MLKITCALHKNLCIETYSMPYFRNIRQSHLLIVLLSATLLLKGCGGETKDNAGAMPAPAVSVLKVTTSAVGDYNEFVSRTEAKEEVNLIARVEGILIARNFNEGQQVTEKQVLFEIDRAPFEAALNQAKANLSSSEAALKKAEADLKRGKEMSRKGFVSQSDLDSLVSKDLQAKSTVEASKAQVQQAEINLSYTTIIAPFDGVIGRANFSTGSLVSASSGPLATLTTLSPIHVYFQVDEKNIISYMRAEANRKNSKQSPSSVADKDDSIDFNSENPDLDLKLRLPDGSMYGERGKLDFSDTKIDESTGTLSVRAVFPNPDRIILPGLYVTLIAESKNKKAKVVIPQFAIQENQKGRFVLAVDENNKVSTRTITTGRRIGPMWVVNSGLKADELIIVEGLQKVQPDIKIKPVLKTINPNNGILSHAQQPVDKKQSKKQTGATL